MCQSEVYFSIGTMTALEFVDIYAESGSILGHVLLTIRVLLGYILLITSLYNGPILDEVSLNKYLIFLNKIIPKKSEGDNKQ